MQFTIEEDNKLAFAQCDNQFTQYGFKSSVYHKPTVTGQNVNINSHHPYNMVKKKKNRVSAQPTILNKTNNYQENKH